MTNDFINCSQLNNINDIIPQINLNQNVNNILNDLYIVSQQYYGPNASNPIECRVLASIYHCILTHDAHFSVSTTTDLPKDIKENQAVILYISPPISSNEYHFIIICKDSSNTYRIYSANGNYFVPPFSISIDKFNEYYHTVFNRNLDDMRYPKDGNINNIPIAQAWNNITGDNLATVFDNLLNENDEDDDEDDDDTDESIWEDLMTNFSRLSYPRNYIWIYTKQTGGKRYKKRKTLRRHKRKNKTKRVK